MSYLECSDQNIDNSLVNIDTLEEAIWNVLNEDEHSDENPIETTQKECPTCRKMEGRNKLEYKRYTEEEMQMALSYIEETG